MQKDLILTIIAPNIRLQPRNCIRNINTHTRRPTHKHTCPPSKDPLPIRPARRHLLQHISQIRSSVFRGPAFLLLAADEGETNEVLLELGRRGGETKIEGCGVWDLDLEITGFLARVCLSGGSGE